MRKVIMFNLISVDGYFEGKNQWDISWHHTDQEFFEYSVDQLKHAGGLIFGRVTYEGMASYWQSPEAYKSDPITTEFMNMLPKFVFSGTLKKAEWKNTRLFTEDATAVINELKHQAGNDLLIFGSGNLSSTLTQNLIIDEYRLLINPIVLGEGNRLFKKNDGMLKLILKDTRTFQNGNVLLSYSPGDV